MSQLRDQILELLRSPDYRPVDEAGLVRALGLGKKQRGLVSHEVRRLLAQNEARRGRGGVVQARDTETSPSQATARPIFQPRSVRLAAGAPASPFDPAPTKPAAGIFQPGKSKAAPAKAKGGHHAAREISEPPAPRARADGITGRIQFRTGGSAYVVAEGEGSSDPSIQIFPEDTASALPGDRVVVRLYPGRKGKRPGETVGRVIQVLERARETVVGELRRSGRHFLVVADDPKFAPEVQVPDPAKSGLRPIPTVGDKVVARLAEWNDQIGRAHV